MVAAECDRDSGLRFLQPNDESAFSEQLGSAGVVFAGSRGDVGQFRTAKSKWHRLVLANGRGAIVLEWDAFSYDQWRDKLDPDGWDGHRMLVAMRDSKFTNIFRDRREDAASLSFK